MDRVKTSPSDKLPISAISSRMLEVGSANSFNALEASASVQECPGSLNFPLAESSSSRTSRRVLRTICRCSELNGRVASPRLQPSCPSKTATKVSVLVDFVSKVYKCSLPSEIQHN